MLFFELDDHDFHGFVAGIDVGVEGVGGHGGKPVGLARLPLMGLDMAVRVDDVHGAAGEGDDDAGVVVVVHGEGLVGEDDGLPDFDGLVVELGEALGLGGGGDLGDDGGSGEGGGEDGCGAEGEGHGGSFAGSVAPASGGF